MDKEKILSGNESIAKFMEGRVFIGKDYFENDCKMVSFSKELNPPHQLDTTHFIEHLEYHKDFNWIMRVVDIIIRKKNFIVEMNPNINQCAIFDQQQDVFYYCSDVNETSFIESLWDAVVEFVEWYNKIKNEH